MVTKRLNIDMPEDLHRALKQQALDSGESVSEIVRKQLQKTVGLKKRATLAINPRMEPKASEVEASLDKIEALLE